MANQVISDHFPQQSGCKSLIWRSNGQLTSSGLDGGTSTWTSGSLGVRGASQGVYSLKAVWSQTVDGFKRINIGKKFSGGGSGGLIETQLNLGGVFGVKMFLNVSVTFCFKSQMLHQSKESFCKCPRVKPGEDVHHESTKAPGFPEVVLWKPCHCPEGPEEPRNPTVIPVPSVPD